MSKHFRGMDGSLLKANKSWSDLSNKQKDKIARWMKDAFQKHYPDDEAVLDEVFQKIDECGIWIPDYEITNRYRAKKAQLRKRLSVENVPQHIYTMESILDKATQMMDALEKKISEYEAFQTEIQKLKAYYTSRQWKDDLAMDEAGKFPDKLKRGVLSEDGIWNMLERNKELLERIGIQQRL